jgi:hypothetical protein
MQAGMEPCAACCVNSNGALAPFFNIYLKNGKNREKL